ncbi:YlbG family protein [Shouchella lonarensis]|uniref:UPF0298 protein SAMN05421737_107150 n=1 Tax=Shouchella lonarensis TaxID=1464122 RepID=A0A1G6KU98_9BACI|nr:YlbG family protein [Shouchella lonarensis]SDC34361.1 Uncharacterized protein YlbG, UPF0298 family [Shouchella lonarensis]
MISRDRQGIVVWLTSLKYARQLRRFGHVQYVSKKMKYVLFYCDQEKVAATMDKIAPLHFVKDVQVSMRPFLATDFQNAKPDKAKEYDYKLGI